LNFLSLCSGIGGFDWGVMLAGHTLVGYAECDTECKKCKTYTQHFDHPAKEFYTICSVCGSEKNQPTHKSFQLLHDPERRHWNAYDIRSVSDDAIRQLGGSIGGGIGLIVAGFPCQAFSIAGKREGFKDATRGTVIYEVLRFASILRPRNLLLENVEGLLTHDGGETFETILCALDELGYDAEWQVLNSAAYVPQNRERIYIAGHLRGESSGKVFPFGREGGNSIEVIGRIDGKGDDYVRRVYGVEGISPALPTMQGGGQEPKILDTMNPGVPKPVERCPTIRASHYKDPLKVMLSENVETKPTQFSVDGRGIAYCLDTGYSKGISNTQWEKGRCTHVVTVGNVNPSGNGMNGQVYDDQGLCPTLTTNKGEGIKVIQRQFKGQYGVSDDLTGTLQASRVDKVPMIVESGLIHSRGFETRKDGISHCLKGGGGGSSGNFLLDKPAMRIRKLTPLECFRLQSYPDEWYALLKLYRQPELIADIDFNRNDITEQVLLLIGNNGIKEGMSDSQLYKMAGNGVTSLVSWDVARRFETIKQDGVK
jgi:DNA (cytosine-5)-methyltransferase 1